MVRSPTMRLPSPFSSTSSSSREHRSFLSPSSSPPRSPGSSTSSLLTSGVISAISNSPRAKMVAASFLQTQNHSGNNSNSPFVRFLLLLLPCLALFYLALPRSSSSSSSVASHALRKGVLHPLFATAGVSHAAFHSAQFKKSFADAVVQPSSTGTKSVAVVGVEWGAEVRTLARNGYHVHAFEALREFAEGVKGLRNVTVYYAAAGKESGGKVNVRYEAMGKWTEELVNVLRVDEVVKERIDVLSVDVQGNELEVVQGCEELLKKDLVRSMWVEVSACNAKAHRLLSLLSSHSFVLFDTIAWGSRKSMTKLAAFDIRNFHERPGGHAISITDYLADMCVAKRANFHWLQTDVIAVHSSLVTPQLLSTFQNIAAHAPRTVHLKSPELLASQ